MTTQDACELVRFLREEAAGESATESSSIASAVAPLAAMLRVPLELEGAIWSAEVEHIDEGCVGLIVDRTALDGVEPDSNAAILYQPDNGSRRHAAGRITVADPLSGHRVRLNFELT